MIGIRFALFEDARRAVGTSVTGWLRELIGLLPAAWRERHRARIEVQVDTVMAHITIVHPSRAIEEGWIDCVRETIEPQSFSQSLKSASSALPVWLFPAEKDLFSRVVQIPRAAVGRFDRFLGVEIDRWTPFSSSEVLAAWKPVSEGDQKVDVEIRFATHTVVDHCSRLVKPFALAPSVLALGSDSSFLIPLTTPRALNPVGFWLIRGLGATFAVALATLVAVDWLAATRELQFWQRQVELERRQLRQQRDLEAKIDSILGATGGTPKSNPAPSKAAVFASLASVLPQSDWLSDVSVRKDTVMLRGYAKNTESLMQLLQPLSASRSATLQGDLSFDPKADRNRFTITFQIAEALR